MKYFLSVFFLITTFYLYAQETSIYVSPNGNDNYKGTKKRPVASLEEAQYLVRKIKRQRRSNDTITVFLREGIYRVKQSIVFRTAIAGTEECPVVFRSYEEEKVVISGATPIKNYKQLSKNHPLYKNDPETGSKIIEIDLLEAGLNEFNQIRLSGFNGIEKLRPYTLRELYFDGKPMPLSRWPNKGFSEFTDVISDPASTMNRKGIVYKDSCISTWEGEPNILLHGYWKHLWADAYEHIYKIDTKKQIIWLSPPYNYYGFEENHPFAAYNVIAEIDQPGEWAYDYRNKRIYFYPPVDMENASLELSTCETPLIVLNNTQWLTFKDICFEMSASEGIQISNSNHINIENCEIHACARSGIIMDGGNNNTISSCEIYDMGRGAIKVSGGNRETLEKSGFIIDNCHIHHLSRIDHTYTPGIYVDGVGTTISHCEIHDVPSSAMRINGNDHTVEYNEMYHVVTESDDQGAIDMWGDPTYRGNVFRYNYIHDVGPYGNDEVNAYWGRAAIRFDDVISGNHVYGNIFRNCSEGIFGAIQIHGGKDNLIQNNLFYQCSAGISFGPWSYERWMKWMKDKGILDFSERNKNLYIAHYPELIKFNEDLNKNTIVQNIFLECGETTLRQEKITIFNDNIEIDESPEIIDLKKNNYSLENLPEDIKTISFEPIPFEKIGLKSN